MPPLWWFFLLTRVCCYFLGCTPRLKISDVFPSVRSYYGLYPAINSLITLVVVTAKSGNQKIWSQFLPKFSKYNYIFQAASEKFAFIYESPYLEYKQQISCDNITDLISVGEQFHEFG